jgi:hypothetical protein
LRRVIFSELRLSNRPIGVTVSFSVAEGAVLELPENGGPPHTVIFP